MTAKQKAAREKFKKVVAEASKLRKKNPSLTQAQAVKQAFAISYSKAGETKKVGAVKKKVPTKPKYVKLLGQEVKVGTKLHEKLVAQKKHFDDLLKSEVGAVKKKAAPKKSATKVKATKRKSTEMHTDTKSHNVNIKVVSGINDDAFLKLKNNIDNLELLENEFDTLKKYKKDIVSRNGNTKYMELYRYYSFMIKQTKKNISDIKKYIK